MNQKQNFLKGILKENPILVSLLGFCPTLAVTTTVENGIAMGAAVIFVLVFSNIVVSLIKNIVPNEIRIPVFIVIIASFVTIVDMVMAAFTPAVHETLGIFIPLIVVNCMILGRAEAFASKNDVVSSIVDGLGMSIGFALVLILLSFIREFLSSGIITIWGDLQLNINALFGEEKFPIFSNFFVSPAGAFIVVGLLFGIVTSIRIKKAGGNK